MRRTAIVRYEVGVLMSRGMLSSHCSTGKAIGVSRVVHAAVAVLLFCAGLLYWAGLAHARAVHPYNAGCAYLAQGKLRSAEVLFLKALRSNPKDTDALNNLAVVRIKQKNYPSALHLLRRALRVNKQYGGAYVNMGAAYIFNNERGKAKYPCARATGASRGGRARIAQAAGFYNLGLVYALGHELKGAEVALLKSLRLRKAADARLCLAVVKAQKKEYGGAIGLLRQLMSDPRAGRYRAPARRNQAMVLYWRGVDSLGDSKLDEAEKDFDSSDQTSSNDFAKLGKALVLAARESGKKEPKYEKPAAELTRLRNRSTVEAVRAAAGENLGRLESKGADTDDDGSSCFPGMVIALVPLGAVGLVLKRRG